MKYPQIKVKLSGNDGNAFFILSLVRQAMRRANIPQGKITEFCDAATKGDYNHLLQTCMEWVDVQ